MPCFRTRFFMYNSLLIVSICFMLQQAETHVGVFGTLQRVIPYCIKERQTGVLANRLTGSPLETGRTD